MYDYANRTDRELSVIIANADHILSVACSGTLRGIATAKRDAALAEVIARVERGIAAQLDRVIVAVR